MTAHLPIQEPDDYSPADLMRMVEVLFSALTSVEELEQEIDLKEAMIEQLRASITTPKYRNADPDVLRQIHWDA